MSVLHSRIMAHGAGNVPGAELHPHGTAATPMIMPLATVDYGGDMQAIYGTAHPIITADGAVIAGRSHRAAMAPHIGATVPAGQP